MLNPKRKLERRMATALYGPPDVPPVFRSTFIVAPRVVVPVILIYGASFVNLVLSVGNVTIPSTTRGGIFLALLEPSTVGLCLLPPTENVNLMGYVQAFHLQHYIV